MKTAAYILEFLKNHTSVLLHDFGVFSIQNTGASLDEENRLLPPGKLITFTKDENSRNPDFINFIATKENTSSFEAELSLKKTTTHWKEELEKNNTLLIEQIGVFWKENNHLFFKGNRLEEEVPDSFGLESFSLSDILPNYNKNPTTVLPEYRFNNSILWIFLIILPVLGLLYLGITRQELLFGKKTFENHLQTSPPTLINSTKTDSVSTKYQDSLNQASQKIQTVN